MTAAAARAAASRTSSAAAAAAPTATPRLPRRCARTARTRRLRAGVRSGRHAAVTAVPARREVVPRRGARPGRRRAGLLDRPGRGDRRPRRGRAGGVAGRPGARRRAGAADRARLRAERAGPRRVGRAGGRAGRVAERPARVLVASRPGAAPADPRPGRPARPRRARSGAATGIARTRCWRELLRLGYEPVLEVAGRGEFARRGGIVDVFPPGADLPVRIEFFGDEIDSLRAFDPTDQRTVGPVEAVDAPAGERVPAPGRGRGGIRARLGRLAGAAAGAPGRRPRPLRASGRPRAGRPAARDPRRCDAGDAAEVWAASLPRHRPRPPRPDDAPGARRAGRGRRRGRVPVGAGRGAAARPGGARASCPGTGRRPTWSRATGRRASSAPGRWS